MLNQIKILGTNITCESREKILEHLFESLRSFKSKLFIITPNPEMLAYAFSHSDYKDKLNGSSIALPDGVGLFFAAGLLNKKLKERITGVDFIEDICKESRKKPVSIGFLGGGAGIAKHTAECLLLKYPWLNIVFVGEEWSEKGFGLQLKRETKRNNAQNNASNVSQRRVTRSSVIDILFVAFGMPKQEEWIYKNLDKLPVKAAMGVGGAFDFISGTIPRAPFIVRYAGLEWLFRLIIQPWRWRRQLALIEFVLLVFKEKFSTTEK